jgi:hypothetical protein
MLSTGKTRLLMLASAALFLAVALAIRAAAGGALEQISGTALYASMVYAGVVFLWPRMYPLVAGAIAIGFCWAVELSQLTGVPAYLSERSIVARLVLGVKYDPADMLWYPAGVIPLVVVHWLLRRNQARRTQRAVAAVTATARRNESATR